MPVAGLRRRRDGQVLSVLGSFIVLNKDGWVLTAGHVVDEMVRAQTSISEARKLAEKPSAGADAPDEAGLTEHLSHALDLWAIPGFQDIQPRIVEANVDLLADLALVKLEPFELPVDQVYPRFRSADKPVDVGSAVCRLGFPFHQIDVVFEDATETFDVRAGFPVPAFASDGMVARYERMVDGERMVLSLQTTTPGLRGQSGGPLVDVDGRVVGLQSRTVHLDLGFDARYQRDGQPVIERQFINVGVAAHVDEIRRMLLEKNVPFAED